MLHLPLTIILSGTIKLLLWQSCKGTFKISEKVTHIFTLLSNTSLHSWMLFNTVLKVKESC